MILRYHPMYNLFIIFSDEKLAKIIQFKLE